MSINNSDELYNIDQNTAGLVTGSALFTLSDVIIPAQTNNLEVIEQGVDALTAYDNLSNSIKTTSTTAPLKSVLCGGLDIVTGNIESVEIDNSGNLLTMPDVALNTGVIDSKTQRMTTATDDVLLNQMKDLIRPDSAYDAFARLRTSSPVTLFETKLIYDKAPLYWDELAETGAGVTSTHSVLRAEVDMTSTLNTACKFTRQTYRRFNYQPGKSLLIMMTGILKPNVGGAGVTRQIGYFGDNNGLIFRENNDNIYVVLRSGVSGSVVDNAIIQSSWNIDPMDGTGPSGMTLDTSKTQIFTCDLEWLGVGRVRFGFAMEGQTYYVHQFLNANTQDSVYMSTPNLCARYQLEVDNASPSCSLKAICCTVLSEGGFDNQSIMQSVHNSTTVSSITTSDGLVPVLGIRLKPGILGCSLELISTSIILLSNSDSLQWSVIFNPNFISGTPTWTNINNSCSQFFVGDVSFEVDLSGSRSVEVSTGFIKSGNNGSAFVAGLAEITNNLLIGSDISGVSDIILIACEAISGSCDIRSSIQFSEIY